MNALMKIILKPVARSVDALLEKLQNQIRTGEKEEAQRTVDELRAAVKEGRKYLEL